MQGSPLPHELSGVCSFSCGTLSDFLLILVNIIYYFCIFHIWQHAGPLDGISVVLEGGENGEQAKSAAKPTPHWGSQQCRAHRPSPSSRGALGLPFPSPFHPRCLLRWCFVTEDKVELFPPCFWISATAGVTCKDCCVLPHWKGQMWFYSYLAE